MKEFKELLEKVEQYCLDVYNLQHCDLVVNHDGSGYVCRNVWYIDREGILFGFEKIEDLEKTIKN